MKRVRPGVISLKTPATVEVLEQRAIGKFKRHSSKSTAPQIPGDTGARSRTHRGPPVSGKRGTGRTSTRPAFPPERGRLRFTGPSVGLSLVPVPLEVLTQAGQPVGEVGQTPVSIDPGGFQALLQPRHPFAGCPDACGVSGEAVSDHLG